MNKVPDMGMAPGSGDVEVYCWVCRDFTQPQDVYRYADQIHPHGTVAAEERLMRCGHWKIVREVPA